MIKLENNLKNRNLKICIVGLGYVGLPTAIFFAENGFHVIGVDKDYKKLELINKGKSPIKEFNLDSRISEIISKGKLTITDDLIKSTEKSDIIIMIVPTPVTKSKDPDLSYIISAGKDISKGLKNEKLVILESTVYPGVTEEILKPILEQSGLKAGKDFGLSYCPERFNPGDEMHTIENVSRILGSLTPEWAELTRKLYKIIIKKEITILSNIKTAEAAKVIENTQRDLNIALMNELAMIFEKTGH